MVTVVAALMVKAMSTVQGGYCRHRSAVEAAMVVVVFVFKKLENSGK
jgi:hypothetical protein